MEENTSTQNSAPTTDGDKTEAKGSSRSFSQDEVNAMMQKRINEINAKNDKATEEAVSKALKEYERKQKMTEEERLNEARKQKDDELAEKERNITLRENRATAIEELAKLNIDTKLVDFVVDLDADKTVSNIEALSKAFNEAVSKGVEIKLAGKTPTDFGDGGKKSSETKEVSSRGYRAGGMTAF